MLSKVRSGTCVVGFLGMLGGCNAVLGIEQRTYVEPVEEGCKTALDCDPGEFCGTSGKCDGKAKAPPTGLTCNVLEPTFSNAVDKFDWSTQSHVLGALFRLNNEGEVPRLEAARLAVRQVNANQGVDMSRRPLVLVACDYGGPSPGNAAGADATAAIESSIVYLSQTLGARAIVAGSSSSATQDAIDTIVSKKIPVALISAFSTSTTLTDYDDTLDGKQPGLLWRTTPDDTQQAKVLGSLIEKTAGVTKLGIVYIDDAYGSPLNAGVSVSLNGKVEVASLPFPATATTDDLQGVLTTLFTQAPMTDALLFVGTDGTMVVNAYQALLGTGRADNVKALFLADAAKEAQTLLAKSVPMNVAALVARSVGTAPYHAVGEPYATMKNDLKTAFARNADDYSFVAQTYDAAFVAASGLAWASASKAIFDGRDVALGFGALSAADAAQVYVGANGWPAARKALTASSGTRAINFVGTSGPLDFDQNGQTTGPMEIWRVNASGTGFTTCAMCTADACDPTPCNAK